MKRLIIFLLLFSSIAAIGQTHHVFSVDGGYTLNYLPTRNSEVYINNKKVDFSYMQHWQIDAYSGAYLSAGLGYYATDIPDLGQGPFSHTIRNSTLSLEGGMSSDNNVFVGGKVYYSFNNFFFSSAKVRLYIDDINSKINMAVQLEMGNSNYAGWFIMPTICFSTCMKEEKPKLK